MFHISTCQIPDQLATDYTHVVGVHFMVYSREFLLPIFRNICTVVELRPDQNPPITLATEQPWLLLSGELIPTIIKQDCTVRLVLFSICTHKRSICDRQFVTTGWYPGDSSNYPQNYPIFPNRSLKLVANEPVRFGAIHQPHLLQLPFNKTVDTW